MSEDSRLIGLSALYLVNCAVYPFFFGIFHPFSVGPHTRGNLNQFVWRRGIGERIGCALPTPILQAAYYNLPAYRLAEFPDRVRHYLYLIPPKASIVRPFLILFLALLSACATAQIKVLIVDGQNNHVVWPKSTIMLKQYLEDTGRFTVDVARSAYTWNADAEAAYLPLAGVPAGEDLPQPQPDPDFAPPFTAYDVVVSNFGWRAAPWPDATQAAFEAYVRDGGGFVSVHAADNSFPEWEAYNLMIGLGGWGGRDERSGPYVYYDNDGELIRDPAPGEGGVHGAQHEFPITVRVADHPITRGMPPVWMTTADECYAMLRGPAENLTVLATGKDRSDTAPTDRHEPALMVIEYGDGRVFHTTLGHDTESQESVGFIVSFLRGVEWAATGTVTQEIPEDFPTADAPSRRSFTLREK